MHVQLDNSGMFEQMLKELRPPTAEEIRQGYRNDDQLLHIAEPFRSQILTERRARRGDGLSDLAKALNSLKEPK